MFKVECPSCNAPYQVDERRVPASGLTMRCPKCSTSFVVRAPAESDLPAPITPSPKGDFRGTMIGVPNMFGGAPSAGTLPSTGLPGTGAPSVATPGRPRDTRLSGTMIGLSSPLGQPTVKGRMGGTMIGIAGPAAVSTAPVSASKPPATVSKPPATVSKPPADSAPHPGLLALSEDDLPSVLEAGLSPPKHAERAPSATSPAAFVVPRPAGDRPPAGKPVEIDFGADDLPSVLSGRGAALSSGVTLPSPGGAGAKPAPGTVGAAKSPPPEAGRGLLAKFPSVAKFDEDDPLALGLDSEPPLPGLKEAPSKVTPAAAKGPAIAASRDRSAAYSDPDLPSVLSALDELDLDAVLPSRQAASLPEPKGTTLPTPKGVPQAGPTKLPESSIKGGGGAPRAWTAAAAPARPPAEDRLQAEVGLDEEIEDILLESLPPSMPPEAPVARASEPGELTEFDELESFRPSADAVAVEALPARRIDLLDLPSPVDDFDLMPSLGGGFGEVALPSTRTVGTSAWQEPSAESDRPAGSVGSGAGAEFDEFSALPNFDDFGVESVPPVESWRRGPARVPPATAARDASLSALGRAAPVDADEDELEEDLRPTSVRTPIASSHEARSVNATRATRVGATYGELDFGSDESVAERDDAGMEFGDIPQAEDGPGTSAPAIHGAELAAAPMPTAKRREAAIAAEPAKATRKRAWKRGVAALGLVIAGGSLALLPEIGPFGAYWVSDQIYRGTYTGMLSQVRTQTQTVRAADQYPSSIGDLRAIASAQSETKRFKPMAAYFAYARYAAVLRFGGQSELQSSAQVALDGLTRAGVTNEVAEYALAKAAEQAIRGPQQAARSAIANLKGRVPELERITLSAEFELREGQLPEAEAAWQQALAVRPCAWTQFGLARVLFAQGKLNAAKDAAQQTLQMNPNHVGARLLLAELAWQASDEKAALGAAEQVLTNDGAASPLEVVGAHTLSGEIHLNRGRISRAEASFGEALKVEPKSVRGLLGLGETFHVAGRQPAALARFEAALAADPRSLAAKLGMVKVLIASDLTDRAQQSLTELVAAYPDSAEVAYFRGRLAEKASKPDEARAAYLFAVQHATEPRVRVEAYVAQAQFEARMGELDVAAKLLRDALQALPDSAQLRKALGEVALTQGAYDDALAEFRKAEQLDPADVSAAFRVGSVYRRLGKFDEATRAFDEVAARDAELPGLPLERGLLLEQSGQSGEALKQYEMALAKAPNDPDVLLRVGCARVAKGDGKGAAEALQDLLKSRPRSAEVNYCAGRAMFLQGKHLEALKRLQQAVDIDSNRAEYHFYVGWAASAAGQMSLAQEQLDKALALDQGLADAYWQRGALSLMQGASADAVTDLKRALKLRPERFEAHADLAQAYTQQGREQDALAEWQQAIAGDDKNPTWLFRYGKLLSAQHKNEEAARRLAAAIELVEKEAVPPNWISQAHFLLAISLGGGAAAVPHYRRFLETGPTDSPYRGEAKRALQRAGQPWEGK